MITNQVKAIALKKFLACFRTWHLLVLQTVLPIFLLVLTVLNSRNYALKVYFSSLEISLKSYQNPVTIISGLKNDYSDAYKNLLKNYQVLEVENVSATVLDLVRVS